ncbi:MAG: thiamine diphosphokinase [Candidatus Cloacimonetes bacterium]|nr:thiamine diphosphokinase [Candidatus Cloacimonadota bacterium]
MSIKAIIYCDDISINQATDIEADYNNFFRFLKSQTSKTNSLKEYLLVSVDSGTNSLYRQEIIPDVIIGDMDSIQPEILEHYRELTTIIIHPSQKDETDTELALNWCIENDIQEILFINRLQGNFAHSWGVVTLLFKARTKGIKAKISNFKELIMLIPHSWSYRGILGKKISLIPLTEVVTGVDTSGLGYPLRKEPLFWHSTRGLSNVFIDSEIKICYDSGELLVVMESTLEEILYE